MSFEHLIWLSLSNPSNIGVFETAAPPQPRLKYKNPWVARVCDASHIAALWNSHFAVSGFSVVDAVTLDA
jgi:hypothetical protein